MPKLSAVALAAATARSDSRKGLTCGYCTSGHHKYCPRAVANEGRTKIWPCACDDPECGGGSILRCLTCKNERPGEVSPAMWECLDPEACAAQVQKNLARNPGYQQIREITMPKATAAKATAAKTAAKKAKAEPRDCADGCGGQTSGGLFLPGHDAKLLSVKVAEVAEGRFTQATIKAVAGSMRELGCSDALLNKFSQRVTIAKDRAAKVAEAARTAPAKTAAAKTARPAAKKAAAKKAVAPAPTPEDDDF